MEWTRIVFSGAKTHFVPTPLSDVLVKTMQARGIEVAVSPDKDPTWSHCQAEAVGLDYGGSRFVREPWMEYTLGKTIFKFPCFELDSIYAALKRAEPRRDLGRMTYKLHGAMHCIVMLPQHRHALLRKIGPSLDEAHAMWNAFMEDRSWKIVRMRQ
jgi:hypothetical protein